MILVDASVWIDHFRRYNEQLAGLLEAREVFRHPYVIGEIALSNLKNRPVVIRSLSGLPLAVRASDAEVMALIEQERLFGRGIGFVDAHLLASARLTSDCRLWTRDQRLHSAAESLGLNMAVH